MTTYSNARNTGIRKPFCKVCHDAGRSDYDTHYLRDRPGGEVVCKFLLSLECRYCGGAGHTPNYCPNKKQEERRTRHQMHGGRIHQVRVKTATSTTQKPKMTNAFDALDTDSDSDSDSDDEEEMKEMKKEMKKGITATDVCNALFHRMPPVKKQTGPRVIFEKRDSTTKQVQQTVATDGYDASGCDTKCVRPALAAAWSNVATAGFQTVVACRATAVMPIQRWVRSVNGGMVIHRCKWRVRFNGCLDEMIKHNPEWQAHIATGVLCQMLGVGAEDDVICASCSMVIDCPDDYNHLWTDGWMRPLNDRFCLGCYNENKSLPSSTDSWVGATTSFSGNWADFCDSDNEDDFDGNPRYVISRKTRKENKNRKNKNRKKQKQK